MGRFSELLHDLAQYERRLAEGQARVALQAEFVREQDAKGHDTSFGAKRLLVMAANLNEMEEAPPADPSRVIGAQKRAGTSLTH